MRPFTPLTHVRPNTFAEAAFNAYEFRLDTVVPEEEQTAAVSTLKPADRNDRSANPLRPSTLAEMVGQEDLKPLLREIIDASRRTGRPMDHIMLTGGSGTGKSTLAFIIANELDRDVYMLDAPLSHERLLELREVMKDGDVLFIDEIHRQVAGDRRGVSAACQPEIFYHVLEDRRIATERGVLPFPAITVIGATTDAGLLPEPFLARFPLSPRLRPYTVFDTAEIARRNASALDVGISEEGAFVLARAARQNPRQVNRYVRNAASLGEPHISRKVARRIVLDLNSTTLDGLTADMALMLRFLYTSGKRVTRGEVRYQASVNTIATALGKSRDTKAVALYVEPWLIEGGYVQVAHGGRTLTEAGITRAQKLLNEEEQS